MSSTDRGVDKLLRRFFVDSVAPAAERLRRRGVKFFETGPTPESPTYYEKHREAASLFVEIGPDACAAIVGEMWKRENLPELVELAGPLFALAPRIAPTEKDEGDVSPFVYVMF